MTHTCPACGGVVQCVPIARGRPLTPRQRAILDYIREHVAERGFAPSFGDIAKRFAFRSLATVHEHLVNLERKGHIRRAWNEARAIELVDAPVPAGAQ
jgi:repressor LexA